MPPSGHISARSFHKQEYQSFIPKVMLSLLSFTPCLLRAVIMFWTDSVLTREPSPASCECKTEQITKPNRQRHADLPLLYCGIFTQAVCKSQKRLYDVIFITPRGRRQSLKPAHCAFLITPKSVGAQGLYLSDVSDSLGAVTPRDRLGLKIDTAQSWTLDVNDISISEE